MALGITSAPVRAFVAAACPRSDSRLACARGHPQLANRGVLAATVAARRVAMDARRHPGADAPPRRSGTDARRRPSVTGVRLRLAGVAPRLLVSASAAGANPWIQKQSAGTRSCRACQLVLARSCRPVAACARGGVSHTRMSTCTYRSGGARSPRRDRSRD